MKLIFALGNPGPEYAAARHNIGWQVIDAFAAQHDVNFREQSKFKAMTAELQIDGEKVILAKPTTFYNLAGEAAQAIASFYKLDASEILIIHDELALDFGTIRTRRGGSDAGNNGVKSLNAHIGDGTFRLRIGVWNELVGRIDNADFVLGRFDQAEAEALPNIVSHAVATVDRFIAGEPETTTKKL